MNSDNRQEFIRAAVSFLQNPKLADSSLKDKLKFLKDKGLSELEVDEALNLALVNRQQSQHSKWNFLIVLGLCLSGYKLYQAYLESRENYLAHQKNLEKQREEEAKRKEREQEEQKLKEKDLPTLKEILKKMDELKRLFELQRGNFVSDVQSLKTLLLGHEKFAAPPVIPEWQLKDSKEKPIEPKNASADNSPTDSTESSTTGTGSYSTASTGSASTASTVSSPVTGAVSSPTVSTN